MNESYTNISNFSFFSRAQRQLDTMISKLESIGIQEHGVTEEYIRDSGAELLRLLLQGHLDKLAHDENRFASVSNADDLPRNHVRQGTTRTLVSLFGPVTVTRLGYSQRHASSLFPLDAQLNLHVDQYSDGVRRRIVGDVIDRSYDRAIEHHKENCAGLIGKRQAIKLTEQVASDFVSFYERRTVSDEQTGDLLVLSFDGKGVVMRPDGLRECTQKSAKGSKKKLQTRLSLGEKKDRKRMAQVTAIYTVHPNPRTAESIMNLDQQENVVKFRPPIRNKRVFASLGRTLEQVIGETFDEVIKRDPEYKVQERALRVLRGQAARVARGIRQSASKRKLEKREAIDKCAGYLCKNKSRLCYDEALSEGLPIASGVIEGACRHLINDRMDVTGARWSLQGGEAIFKLCSIRSSGDWDEYWKYHLSRSEYCNYGELLINESAS